MFHFHQFKNEERLATGEFDCPHCQARCRFSLVRLVETVIVFFIPRTHTLEENVCCQSCGLSFGLDVLGVPSAQNNFLASISRLGVSVANLRNVVEFSEPAAAEIRRRMAAGKFEPNLAVRIVPHRAGSGCDIQFDLPHSEGPDWLGRSRDLSVLIDKRDAETIRGATVDFESDEFRIVRK